jgi:hypothetical protein
VAGSSMHYDGSDGFLARHPEALSD